MIDADVPHGRPDRFTTWADARLTGLGLNSPFRRDCALAVVTCLGMSGLLLVLLADPAQIPGLVLSPSQTATALVVVAVQSLLLCLRRVSPVLCLWAMAVLQVAMFAALPAGVIVRHRLLRWSSLCGTGTGT